jgi:glycosyltransferase involved in cell wall biosynthesis
MNIHLFFLAESGKFKIVPMNILELNFEKTWRGGERQTIYNMQGFRDTGFHVSLLCCKDCPLEARAEAEGFETFSFHNIFGALFFLLFKCRRFDLFHVQSSHMLTYAVLAKRFNHKRIIFTRRILNVPKGRFTRWKYLASDKIVAISPAIKKIIERFVHKEVRVISDIVEEKKLNRHRAKQMLDQLPGRDKFFIIGTTAALTKEKGPFVMLEAIRTLAAKRSDFIFVHFGSGQLEQEMREAIKKYELEDIYYLMGFVENVEDIFSVLNVFAMSSELEGLGSSVLDAFIYRVPVVSTDAGGLGELLQDGRGILCKMNAPDLLAAGINELLTNPGKIDGMTRKAFEYVRQFHSLAYITRQYTELIQP